MNGVTIEPHEALAIATIAGAIYQAKARNLRHFPAGARGEIPPETVDPAEVASEALDVWTEVRTAVREHNSIVTKREDQPLKARSNGRLPDAGSCFSAGGSRR